MSDCIFCKIINNELPSEKVFEDEEIIAFKDINPLAPVHILIVPKKHIISAEKIEKDDILLYGKLIATASSLAERYHLINGFRIITNVGEHGGQMVKHLHFHLLGGKALGVLN